MAILRVRDRLIVVRKQNEKKTYTSHNTMIPGFYFSDDHGDNVVQHERPTAGVGVLPVPGLDSPSCVLPMLLSLVFLFRRRTARTLAKTTQNSGRAS